MTNTCPSVTKVVVSPRQAAIGEEITVTAAATDSDGDPITYLWESAAGSFADATSVSTKYTCQEQGTHSLSITVSDPDSCTATSTATVVCVE